MSSDPPSGPASEASPGREAQARDHERIRRAQGGDERAFEALVRDHQARAYRIARSMVPTEEDARDIVQEAFLRVFRSLERFDFDHAFGTWLNRIVTNLAIDHLRKRRSTVRTGPGGDEDEPDAVELELPDPDQPDPSRRLESEETADAVRACIDSLAPHFQAVLTLREIEGMACTEIAEIVGATHVTVRWRLHRGRKLFQEEWERRERLRERARSRNPDSPPNSGAGEP